MGSTLKTAPRKRIAALDSARAIAVMAVIMIHVTSNLVIQEALGSSRYIWGNLFNGLSRIGVPFFVMISGALMLDEEREVSLKDLYLKKIPKTILLLVLWSGVYALIYQVLLPIYRGESVGIKSALYSFIMGHYHLWYLYMQIGLYMAVPFLRCFVKKANAKLVLLFLGISFATRFSLYLFQALSNHWPMAEHIIIFIQKFNFEFFGLFISYYLAGWYIVHVGIPQKKTRLMFYGAAFCALAVMVLYAGITKEYNVVYADSGALVFLYSTGLFLALNNGAKKEHKLIRIVSKYNFGMYVTHVAFWDLVQKLLPKTIAPPLYILICFALVSFLSLGGTYILSKLPLLKKAVRA